MSDVSVIKIPNTDEIVELKIKLFNALENVYMQRCKFPAKIREGNLQKSKVINFGYGDRRGKGFGIFRGSRDYPETDLLLKEYFKKLCPLFNYSVITVNRDMMMKKHLDKKNVGISCLTCLGKYTEGGGMIVYKDSYDEIGKTYNCKNNVISFDGSTMPHETESFIGRRYTLVFYNKSKKIDKSCSLEQAILRDKEIEELVQLSLKYDSEIEEKLEELV